MAFRRDKALEAAQQHAAQGDLSSAVREYQSVVDNDPSDVQSWLLLADILHRAGDVSAAVDRYAHAANLMLEGGELPKALQVYRQVLNLAPERYDIHMRAAQAFEQLRRIPEAVALYEKVAGVYLRSGNTREALMLYERVADLMPREVGKRLRLAELFSRERRVDDAIEQFQRGADFLRDAERTQEYIRVAERLLYHRPVDAVARELVRAYLEVGQGRRALMKLNELLQRSKNDPEGLELLADTFVSLEKKNKAVSVALELVKHQRDAGPEGKRRCIRVLRKAATWAPENKAVSQALTELGGDEVEEEVEEFDEIEEFEEIEELDEFEEFEELEEVEESAALEPVAHTAVGRPSTPPPRRGDDAPVRRDRSLTQEVISEGAVEGDDSALDVDKQIEEVRVLMKYHLYEHALGYAEQILTSDPEQGQTLELSAEILAALGRNEEAADARARYAALLVGREPTAAARQVELALALIPDHPLAVEIGERLSEISGVDVGVAEVAEPAPPFERDDPLGVLDDDDFNIDSSDSLIGHVDDLGADFDPNAERSYLEGSVEAATDDETDTISLSAADPGLGGELAALAHDDDDFSISLDSGPEELPEPEPEEMEDRFGLGDEGDPEDLFGLDDEVAEISEGNANPIVGRVDPAGDAEPAGDADRSEDDSPFSFDDDDEDELPPLPEPEPEPEEWLDLEAELEELEFYFMQDLEEDARAAFDDLVELFPGHPSLIELAPRFGLSAEDVGGKPSASGSAALSEPSVDAAAPLLDLDDEDDDDDFLNAIFDEEAPKQRKQRKVEIQSTGAEDADASDHFDLGTAYRGMGLFDKAYTEYEAASTDPRWQAKALVMMGSIRAQSGDTDSAIELFDFAINSSRTKDERCEANYELAMVRKQIGDIEGARAALEQIEPGFRDRDEQLSAL